MGTRAGSRDSSDVSPAVVHHLEQRHRVEHDPVGAEIVDEAREIAAYRREAVGHLDRVEIEDREPVVGDVRLELPSLLGGGLKHRVAVLLERDEHPRLAAVHPALKELESERGFPGPRGTHHDHQGSLGDTTLDHLVEPLDSEFDSGNVGIELVVELRARGVAAERRCKLVLGRSIAERRPFEELVF